MYSLNNLCSELEFDVSLSQIACIGESLITNRKMSSSNHLSGGHIMSHNKQRVRQQTSILNNRKMDNCIALSILYVMYSVPPSC